jgi:hypothetical protein
MKMEAGMDRNQQVRVALPNGYQVSMVWHGINHAVKGTVETAIIKPDGDFYKWQGDDVQAFQNARDVARTLAYAASL